MKLEYLFLDSKNKETLAHYTYTPKTKSKKDKSIKIKVNIIDFEETDKWALHIELKGNNENVAKHLSAINDEIIEFNPTVLLNESAAYFNKMIFPLANEFERKLRKLIYVKSTLYNDKKDNTDQIVMKALETKDLGQLYELLFADENLVKTFRKKIGERNSSKLHYQKLLHELPENSTWNVLMGDKKNDYIKEHFLDIIDFRNDTMHAHNISYSKYRKQKNTFKRAIKILDKEIAQNVKSPIPIEAIEKLNNELLDMNNPKLNLKTFIPKLLYLIQNNYIVDDAELLDTLFENENEKRNFKNSLGSGYEQHTF